jgi:SET domain
MKIAQIEGRGRCLVANRNYAAGEVVLVEEPYAMVVSEGFAEVCCSYCARICADQTMFALSSNDCVRYCSEACITADFQLHSAEVAPIEALLGTGVQGRGMDAMRLTLRIASVRKFEKPALSLGKLNVGGKPPLPLSGKSNTFDNIRSMEANKKSVSQDAAREVVRTAIELSKIAAKGQLPLTLADAEFLFYVIQCNAHQVLNRSSGRETDAGADPDADPDADASGEGRPVALGLFPLTSMMNHSCAPNCMHQFLITPGRPPRLVMKAITPIKTGDELCYSYVNLYQSTTSRRDQLFKAYSFHCSCERCSCCDDTIQKNTEISGDGNSNGTINGEAPRAGNNDSARSGSRYPVDTDIDAVEEGKNDGKDAEFEELIYQHANALSRVEQSGSELGSDTAGSECNSAPPELTAFISLLGSPSALKYHPAHRVMLHAYLTIAIVSTRIVKKWKLKKGFVGVDDSVLSALKSAIACGLLALGCMNYYVKAVQPEIGNLARQVVALLDVLLGSGIDERFSGDVTDAGMVFSFANLSCEEKDKNKGADTDNDNSGDSSNTSSVLLGRRIARALQDGGYLLAFAARDGPRLLLLIEHSTVFALENDTIKHVGDSSVSTDTASVNCQNTQLDNKALFTGLRDHLQSAASRISDICCLSGIK